MNMINEEKTAQARAMSRTVLNLYTALATLEKEGKEETEEYKNLLMILAQSVQYEKRDYHNLSFAVQDKEKLGLYFNIRQGQVEKCFQLPSQEMLILIRSFNHSHEGCICTLSGIISDSVEQQLQDRAEENFLIQIDYYLKNGQLTNEERNCLIDFKYGLFSFSRNLEEKLLSGESMTPYTNIDMTEEELAESEQHIFPQISALLDYLWSLSDIDITVQALLSILYVKSSMVMLPPLLSGMSLQELGNSISLNRALGYINGESREKISDMISYLMESSNQEKIKE